MAMFYPVNLAKRYKRMRRNFLTIGNCYVSDMTTQKEYIAAPDHWADIAKNDILLFAGRC